MRINASLVSNCNRQHQKLSREVSVVNSSNPVSNNSSSDFKSIYDPQFSGLFSAIFGPPKPRLPLELRDFAGTFYEVKIFDKLKKQPAAVYLCDSGNGLRLYDCEGEKLGVALIYSDEWTGPSKTIGSHINKEVLDRPYLKIDYLENLNRDRYSGIGKILVHAAVEKSRQTPARGRVFLLSSNPIDNDPDSFMFYNKLGFVLGKNPHKKATIGYFMKGLEKKHQLQRGELFKMLNAETGANFRKLTKDEKFVKLYQVAAKLEGKDVNQLELNFRPWMYLHDKQVESVWAPQISKSPILTAENRRV